MQNDKPKKKFKDTKIFGFFKNALIGGVKEVPIFGTAISNVLSPEGGKGKYVLNIQELTGQLIVGALVLIGVLTAFFGLDAEVAQSILDLIKQVMGSIAEPVNEAATNAGEIGQLLN